RLFDSFKVSKRRELDISIVAAAFVVDLDGDGIVRHARLAYGGVAATPVRARGTETLLLGRPWSKETVAAVLPTVAEEFTPIDDVRARARYRRELIPTLFEKFFSGEQSESQDALPDFSFSCVPESSACGAHRALSHESGVGHTTGAAVYVDDQA